MFTGLVAGTARVRRIEPVERGVRLAVHTPLAAELRHGDSIAVNGVCLTALEPGEEHFEADVMAQTLASSSLGGLSEGDAVNVELPLRAGDRLGGHIVQGHVDGTAMIESITDAGSSRVLRFRCDESLSRYLVSKGSVAVNGVSLTVASLDADGFSVSLIPETLERTTLGEAAVGETVNLEVDVLAKYVERLVTAR